MELREAPESLEKMFQEFLQTSTDPNAIFAKYFAWSEEVSLDDVKSYNVPR